MSSHHHRGPAKIHPIITYPFRHPGDTRHLKHLYDTLVRSLAEDPKRYVKPLTVIPRQTYYANESKPEFQELLRESIEPCSRVQYVWSIDTCQMWLAGFGQAFDHCLTSNDVFWLIPADFDYASSTGDEVMKTLPEIANNVHDGNSELCLGEIRVPPDSSKQLIDTYGTYGLLYNWFPEEAQVLRRITDKPRSEFFAIKFDYLRQALEQRWYAYEQTLVILLQGLGASRPHRRIARLKLRDIADDPSDRDTLATAMQQVERTERVLKLYWREVHGRDPLWPDKFRQLDQQSEKIRSAAMVILQHSVEARR